MTRRRAAKRGSRAWRNSGHSGSPPDRRTRRHYSDPRPPGPTAAAIHRCKRSAPPRTAPACPCIDDRASLYPRRPLRHPVHACALVAMRHEELDGDLEQTVVAAGGLLPGGTPATPDCGCVMNGCRLAKSGPPGDLRAQGSRLDLSHLARPWQDLGRTQHGITISWSRILSRKPGRP